MHASGLEHSSNILSTGPQNVLVLGLLEHEGHLTACLLKQLILGIQLGDSEGNGVLLSTDDNLVLNEISCDNIRRDLNLFNIVGWQVDANTVLLDELLGKSLLESGNQRLESLEDGETHDVRLGLNTMNQSRQREKLNLVISNELDRVHLGNESKFKRRCMKRGQCE